MPPLRTPGPSQPSLIPTLLLVVVLTIVTTVGTNYAIVRYGWIPAPAKPVAGKPVVTSPKPRVVVSSGAPVSAADDADAMHLVSDAAAAVISTIDAVRNSAGPGFVGPSAHTGLNGNFNSLTAAATNVVNAADNGPAAIKQAMNPFIRTLDNSIRNAVQISQRPTESAESVQIAAQVASALGDIRATLP